MKFSKIKVKTQGKSFEWNEVCKTNDIMGKVNA